MILVAGSIYFFELEDKLSAFNFGLNCVSEFSDYKSGVESLATFFDTMFDKNLFLNLSFRTFPRPKLLVLDCIRSTAYDYVRFMYAVFCF